MRPRGSAAELLVLQALRLAGLADESAITDRSLLTPDGVRPVLEDALRAGDAEQMSFADVHGWMLTEAGRDRLGTLLRDELAAADARSVLVAMRETFEEPGGINARFVEVVSRWQLRSTAPTRSPIDPGDLGAFEALLEELSRLGRSLRQMLAAPTTRLPRLGRYPGQFDRAVAAARTEGLHWVTGIGILSCHTVWAELHQDLRSTLAAGPDPGPCSEPEPGTHPGAPR